MPMLPPQPPSPSARSLSDAWSVPSQQVQVLPTPGAGTSMQAELVPKHGPSLSSAASAGSKPVAVSAQPSSSVQQSQFSQVLPVHGNARSLLMDMPLSQSASWNSVDAESSSPVRSLHFAWEQPAYANWLASSACPVAWVQVTSAAVWSKVQPSGQSVA